MPKGSPDIVERGRKTQFSGETAAEAGRKGNAARRRNAPVRQCLRGIATEVLYGRPPLPDGELKPVAAFFHIGVKDVTFAHLAMYRQAVEMGSGSPGALNLVAAYAGEKPVEKVEIAQVDMTALDEAFADEPD